MAGLLGEPVNMTCPVCCGAGGWDKKSGQPTENRSPIRRSTDEWMLCPMCDGRRFVNIRSGNL